jgi:predicted MPP superfamily phosphohydrolase
MPRRRLGRRFFWSFFLGALLLLVYAYAETYWIELKEITVSSRDLPQAFSGKRIVFLTDIHRGPFFSQKRLEKLVERVNGLQPDLILFGGDYIHRSPEFIPPCFAALGKLHAPLGKFGVLGNHDHWESAALTRQYAARAGIRLLDNRAVWIYQEGARIRLGGVGDLLRDISDSRPTLEDVRANDFVMLLSHNPDYIETIHDNRIDLVLSGHSHGGQITFFGWWAPVSNSYYGEKYRTGLVKTPYTKAVISNGIGTITPPLRFFARPQIILITLKRIE